MFAIFGTLISVASVTGALYFFTSFIPSPPYFRVLDLMYFGAIISATDPVTILTIFQVARVACIINVQMKRLCHVFLKFLTLSSVSFLGLTS